MTYVRIMTRDELFETLERKYEKLKRMEKRIEEKNRFLANRLGLLIRLGEEIQRYREQHD